MAERSAVFFPARPPPPVRVRVGTPPAMYSYTHDNRMIERGRSATVDSQGEPTCSHYMYGNLYGMGKLAVPQGLPTEQLARAVVTDFRDGVYGALTENKPAHRFMRMYFDWDLEMQEKPTDAFWAELESIEKSSVRMFFPNAAPDDPIFRSLVLASGLREALTADGQTTYKAGVHTVYTNLFVSVDMALYISSTVLARAEKAFKADPGVWEKRIDRKVYAAARGLRWAWQLRPKKCPSCVRRTATGGEVLNTRGCDACHGGQVADTLSSMYAPVYRVDGLCRREMLPDCRHAPTVELLLEASIRYVETRAPTAGFKPYDGAPPIPTLHTTRNTVKIAYEGERGGSTKSGTLITPSDPCFQALQSAVRRVHPNYASVDIERAVLNAPKTMYRVNVRNAGSAYCMNKRGDHMNARVKFIVTRNGVRQECWCQCEQLRQGGVRCADYSSPLRDLLEPERVALFGAVAKPPADVDIGAITGLNVQDIVAMVNISVADRVARMPTVAACANTSQEQRLRAMVRHDLDAFSVPEDAGMDFDAFVESPTKRTRGV